MLVSSRRLADLAKQQDQASKDTEAANDRRDNYDDEDPQKICKVVR
jgi:hypothetical protein